MIQELRDQLFVLEDFKLHKGDYDREMDELRNSMEQGITNTTTVTTSATILTLTLLLLLRLLLIERDEFKKAFAVLENKAVRDRIKIKAEFDSKVEDIQAQADKQVRERVPLTTKHTIAENIDIKNELKNQTGDTYIHISMLTTTTTTTTTIIIITTTTT